MEIPESENIPYGYIYITTNLINGKQYLGQHRSQVYDPLYKGSGKILKNAINKYGKENFYTEVLEWCYSDNELSEREKYWIEYFNAVEDKNWYNLIPGGGGVQLFGESNPMYGKHHTNETKEKISNALKGLMAGENNPMYGVHLEVSEETRKKISESNKGLLIGDKNPMYGKPSPMQGKQQSAEARLKNSLAHIGTHPNIPPETKERLSKLKSERMRGENNPQFGKKGELSPNYGRHPSQETKEKLSQANKGKQTGFNNPSCKPIYDTNSEIVFSCIREVSEYFNLTYAQARYKIDHEIPIDFNNHVYVLTRSPERRWLPT